MGLAVLISVWLFALGYVLVYHGLSNSGFNAGMPQVSLMTALTGKS